jgi:hypothetical protein
VTEYVHLCFQPTKSNLTFLCFNNIYSLILFLWAQRPSINHYHLKHHHFSFKWCCVTFSAKKTALDDAGLISKSIKELCNLSFTLRHTIKHTRDGMSNQKTTMNCRKIFSINTHNIKIGGNSVNRLLQTYSLFSNST